MNSYAEKFPLLKRVVQNKPLVYFDNAATTPKPEAVLNAIDEHYKHHAGNPNRSTHTLANEAAQVVESCRAKVLEFLHAQNDYEVIFTKNTTESLNIIANSLKSLERESVITTQAEHHSNFLPWQRATQRLGIKMHVVPVTKQGSVSVEPLLLLMRENHYSLLAIHHSSNVTGAVIDLELICDEAQKYNTYVVLDAAQSIAHKTIDLTKTPVDFLAASAHKMYGPEGVGILVVKKTLFAKLEPLLLGGGMVDQVTEISYKGKTTAELHEAGTPNTAGIAGFKASLEFLHDIGLANIHRLELELTKHALIDFEEIPDIQVINGIFSENRAPIFSFSHKSIHPHDIASYFDDQGIAVRAGLHCAEPLHIALGLKGTVRISLSFFNTTEELDYFMDTLKACLQKYA